jgi:hypothetical protein
MKVAAAFAEAGTRLPNVPFAGAVLASSIVVFLLGGMLIVRARSTYFRNGADAKMPSAPRWSPC